jgi:hypothetical protein
MLPATNPELVQKKDICLRTNNTIEKESIIYTKCPSSLSPVSCSLIIAVVPALVKIEDLHAEAQL